MQLLRGLIRPIALAVSAVHIARRSYVCAAGRFVPKPQDRGVLMLDGTVGLREMQEIVGHPTPFAILRHLFESDPELVELSSSVRKLFKSRHPLAETARYVCPKWSARYAWAGLHPAFALFRKKTLNSKHRWFFADESSLQLCGLTVLLVSKAINTTAITSSHSPLDVDQFGIISHQRALAEIVETIHCACLIHLEIMDVARLDQSDVSLCEEMQFGNKLAILSGDFLLAKACKGLAGLHSVEIVSLMSRAISDMMEGAFFQFEDDCERAHITGVETEISGESLTDPEGWSLEDVCLHRPEIAQVLRLPQTAQGSQECVSRWLCRSYLQYGSLLANSCLAASQIASLPEGTQIQVFELAQNLAMVQQLQLESPQLPHSKHLGAANVKELTRHYCVLAVKTLQSLPDSAAKTVLLKLCNGDNG